MQQMTNQHEAEQPSIQVILNAMTCCHCIDKTLFNLRELQMNVFLKQCLLIATLFMILPTAVSAEVIRITADDDRIDSGVSNQGWTAWGGSAAAAGEDNDNHLTGNSFSGREYRSFYYFSLSKLEHINPDDIVSVTFAVWSGGSGSNASSTNVIGKELDIHRLQSSQDFIDTFSNARSNQDFGAWNELNQDTIFNSTTFSSETANQTYLEFELNAAGVSHMQEVNKVDDRDYFGLSAVLDTNDVARLFRYSGAEAAYIDVTVIPEPASLSLLAIPGLLVLQRRRH